MEAISYKLGFQRSDAQPRTKYNPSLRCDVTRCFGYINRKAPLEKMLLNRANDLGIPSFHIFDAWYDYIPRIAETFGGIEAPKKIIVLDRFAAAEMVAAGISKTSLRYADIPPGSK